jgi:hypothetical protein
MSSVYNRILQAKLKGQGELTSILRAGSASSSEKHHIFTEPVNTNEYLLAPGGSYPDLTFPDVFDHEGNKLMDE